MTFVKNSGKIGCPTKSHRKMIFPSKVFWDKFEKPRKIENCMQDTQQIKYRGSSPNRTKMTTSPSTLHLITSTTQTLAKHHNG